MREKERSYNNLQKMLRMEKILKIFSLISLFTDLIVTITFESLDILTYTPNHGNIYFYILKVINLTIS